MVVVVVAVGGRRAKSRTARHKRNDRRVALSDSDVSLGSRVYMSLMEITVGFYNLGGLQQGSLNTHQSHNVINVANTLYNCLLGVAQHGVGWLFKQTKQIYQTPYTGWLTGS